MYLADRYEEDKGHRCVAQFVDHGSRREKKIVDTVSPQGSAQQPGQEIR